MPWAGPLKQLSICIMVLKLAGKLAWIEVTFFQGVRYVI